MIGQSPIAPARRGEVQQDQLPTLLATGEKVIE
jgi:hypothetical protein